MTNAEIIFTFEKNTDIMLIDEMIYERSIARQNRQYSLSDMLRDKLDNELVFCFDTPQGQEVYYLTESFFKKKPLSMTNRQYLESRIQSDIRAEKLLQAWLYTIKKTL